MRTVLFATLLPLCAPVMAQTQMKLTQAKALVMDHPLAKDRPAMTALQAQGLTQEQQDLVLRYSDANLFPPGLRTDSARQANSAYIPNYTVFPVAHFMQDTTNLVIIMVPAQQNVHMPEDLRPVADIYLIAQRWALVDAKEPNPRPVISRGPRWKDLPPARIVRTDDLYASYDLVDDEAALAEMQRAGLPQADIDAVVFRAHERNWPEGIDRFERRQANLASFAKYKAYRLVQWDNKVLLVIPVEKNKHMPILLRPYVDIYFVYSKGAVSVKEPRKR
ncbi:MAG: hypothetical protein JNM31_11135 [Flavobacteriales bacterium]|nr:hypothetical protein [Flavobacteriales bacterium]